MDIVIRLTAAQMSAIECSGILDGVDDLSAAEVMLAGALRGHRLTVSEATQDGIAEAVNEMSNSEDAQAEEGDEMAGYARRAAVALSNLYGKVLRMEVRS